MVDDEVVLRTALPAAGARASTERRAGAFSCTTPDPLATEPEGFRNDDKGDEECTPSSGAPLLSRKTTSRKGVDMDDNKIDSVTWADISLDATAGVYEVFKIPLEKLTSKHLRTLCSRLKVRKVKNAKKFVMIQKIGDTHKIRAAHARMRGSETGTDDTTQSMQNNTGSAPRREPQCPYRLMNLLFSDDYFEPFSRLGDTADHHFWELVADGFSHAEKYSLLAFVDDPILKDLGIDIDMTKVVRHKWDALRKMWKGIYSEYKKALSKFTLSGTHTRSFYTFCDGNLHAYYLRLLLDSRPQLTATTEADLSDYSQMEEGRREDDIGTTGNNSKKRKRDDNLAGDLGITLQNTLTATGSKMSFQEKDSADKEKTARSKRALMEHDISLRKDMKRQSDWDWLLKNIEILKKSYKNETDEELKADTLKDLKGFIRKKNMLAVKLGIRDE